MLDSSSSLCWTLFDPLFGSAFQASESVWAPPNVSVKLPASAFTTFTCCTSFRAVSDEPSTESAATPAMANVIV